MVLVAYGAILLAVACAGYLWGRWKAVLWLGVVPWAVLSIGADAAWWTGLWDRSDEYEPLPLSIFVFPIWIPCCCVALLLAVGLRRATRADPSGIEKRARPGASSVRRMTSPASSPPSSAAMAGIASVTLEAPDPAAAEAFYAAWDVGAPVDVRAAEEPSSGFRGFTLSLLVSQPSTVDTLVRAALDAGATALKPPAKSFWGYGGVVQAPDGAIWKVASSSKRDKGPATRKVDAVALLLGVQDVKASKAFYAERGLSVGKSFGGRYVEFDTPGAAVELALYGRRALAKDAGVPEDGSGSHRIVIRGGGSFTDPDGFAWQAA